MRSVPFFDRQDELKTLNAIVSSPPNLITFLYGPINSGKTTLLSHFISSLPPSFASFSISLRETTISSPSDLIETIFEVFDSPATSIKDIARDIIEATLRHKGIPLPKSLVDRVFGSGKPKDAFRYAVEVLSEISKSKTPVLVFDELARSEEQRIKAKTARAREIYDELQGVVLVLHLQVLLMRLVQPLFDVLDFVAEVFRQFFQSVFFQFCFTLLSDGRKFPVDCVEIPPMDKRK
jgi:AAA+ ATPase superfamily predicted ATPase